MRRHPSSSAGRRRTTVSAAVGAGLLALLVLSSCGQPPATRGTGNAPPGGSEREQTVRVSLDDAGGTIRLSVGQFLVVETGGAARGRWVVGRCPRAVLGRIQGRGAAGEHWFEATAPGRGEVLLLNLAGLPEGECGPRLKSARRCLLPAASSDSGSARPERLRILGFQVVVR
jgi:hypothetical protein